jgi:hypothetical protein
MTLDDSVAARAPFAAFQQPADVTGCFSATGSNVSQFLCFWQFFYSERRR